MHAPKDFSEFRFELTVALNPLELPSVRLSHDDADRWPDEDTVANINQEALWNVFPGSYVDLSDNQTSNEPKQTATIRLLKRPTPELKPAS